MSYLLTFDSNTPEDGRDVMVKLVKHLPLEPGVRVSLSRHTDTEKDQGSFGRTIEVMLPKWKQIVAGKTPHMAPFFTVCVPGLSLRFSYITGFSSAPDSLVSLSFCTHHSFIPRCLSSSLFIWQTSTYASEPITSSVKLPFSLLLLNLDLPLLYTHSILYMKRWN